MNPCIAIIDSNTLSNMAMKGLLMDVNPHIEVICFQTIEEFIQDSNRHFVHFFVSQEILFNNLKEFETLKRQTIVLGNSQMVGNSGFKILDITLPEHELVGNLLHLYQSGHSDRRSSHNGEFHDISETLSTREKDVLKLIVKGFINKEIADKLNISTATVIFHRNNICEKMGTRSISKLTIYAVLSGIVELNDI